MAVNTITQFKNQLEKLEGLARSNLFAVNINLPNKFFMYSNCSLGDQNASRKKTLKLLCRGALLPGSQIASVDVPYRGMGYNCLLYTSPSPRDATLSRMPSSA